MLSMIAAMRPQTEELHRNSRQFQRLHIHIARTNGWGEEGEWLELQE